MSVEPWDIVFFVPGLPRTAGSKRAFVPKGWTRAIVTDASAASKPWKADVKLFASEHAPGALIEGPVELDLTFYFDRPKGHYRTGRNAGMLRPDAPIFPATRPDIDKLSRAILDALTSVVWKDDAQVTTKLSRKRYVANSLGSPGVEIKIGRDR